MLGELRDCSYEAQHHRASGLNLVVATIILWNTVYLELASRLAHLQLSGPSGTSLHEEYRARSPNPAPFDRHLFDPRRESSESCEKT
jgi:Tn3 transposase DDE domain